MIVRLDLDTEGESSDDDDDDDDLDEDLALNETVIARREEEERCYECLRPFSAEEDEACSILLIYFLN